MANAPPGELQRWVAKRRLALVLSILKGGPSSRRQAARKHGLTVAELEAWRERFLLAAENGLRPRPQRRAGPQRGAHHASRNRFDRSPKRGSDESSV